MATYSIVRLNSTTVLNTNDISLVSLSGVGIPPMQRITQTASTMDGVIDEGYKLLARQMVMQLSLNKSTRSDIEDLRGTVADIFKPNTNKDLFSLKIVKDNGDTRQIDCALNGELDFPLVPEEFASNVVSVPLIAANPIWYDPVQKTQTLGIATWSGSVTNLDYAGTWYEQPLIDITGAFFSLNIRFSTPTGYGNEDFGVTGSIPDNELWEVSFLPNNKYFKTGSTSKLDTLISASLDTLAHGKLYPTSEMASTQTATVSYSPATTTGNSDITLKYYNRYIAL